MNNYDISEKTATELSEAIKNMADTTSFTDGIENLLKSQINLIKSKAKYNEARLYLKYLQAWHITKWYRKRKYEKAKIISLKLSQIKDIVNDKNI